MQVTLVKGIREFSEQEYPIVGELKEEIIDIAEQVRGARSASGSCMERAWKGGELLPGSTVIMGSMYVASQQYGANYGYEYRPHMGEFHAWLFYKKMIVDFSLPEVIRMGLESSDDYGPFIVGRKPVILAGIPMSWLSYRPVETFDEFEVRRKGGKL